MESVALPSSTIVLTQPQLSASRAHTSRLVLRLGGVCFVLGACAFLIHYISLDHLGNFSPFNTGLISGFFLMIAGLASIAAGYHETSYRYYVHAQVWSFIVNLILAPALIIMSIAALIIDSHDIHPVCQPVAPSARLLPLADRSEAYAQSVLCLQATNLFDLTRMLNIAQLMIGVICFVAHMILLPKQKAMIKQLRMEMDAAPKEIVVYTQSSSAMTGKPAHERASHVGCIHPLDQHPCYADPPPKYEDLVVPPTVSQ